MPSLTVQDLEKIQAQLPDYRLELVNGEVRVMSPSGYESDEVASRITIFIGMWALPRNAGRVTGSSAGFSLMNTRAPDVSFVRADRLPRSPRGFATLPPDLMVEVKSPSDRIEDLRARVDEFLAQGTIVGILVNPEDHTVEVRRFNQAPVILQDGDILAVPDVLPDWEVAVVDLWSPEF
jgi:Uma2 family endonuclease